MLIKQMSVFVENATGRLAELTKVLKDNQVDIKASCIADTVDFGIFRCIVDQPEEAIKTLKEHGFTASITEVIAAEIVDQPGGLFTVLDVLARAEISVEYMYSAVRAKNNAAIIVIKVAEPGKAVEVLKKSGIPLHGLEILA